MEVYENWKRRSDVRGIFHKRRGAVCLQRSTMASINICDSHFHIWNLEKQNLPWLATTDGTITKTYLFSDYLQAWSQVAQELKSEADIDVDFLGGIYVEVDGDNPLQEDEIIYGDWKKEEKLLACVMRSRIEPQMRAPLFAQGVREPLHIPENPAGRCLEPSFIEGLRYMAKHGFVFDSCNRVEELSDFLSCAKQVPELTIILNHLGNVAELNDDYKKVMQEFAQLSNVYVKVSGFPTGDAAWSREVLSFTKSTFDPKKLIFASNWPVVHLYGTLKDHVFQCFDVFGEDQDFWANNTKRAYQLDM